LKTEWAEARMGRSQNGQKPEWAEARMGRSQNGQKPELADITCGDNAPCWSFWYSSDSV
jgi:hypothetical protein